MTTYATPGMTPEVIERLKKALGPVTDASRPLKRQGRPDDVANAAVYFASERAAQVTGVVMPVDGGASAGDAVNHLKAIMDARASVIAS
jgi:NAD(P)-dependent dehydrogenase (short-subunit alcohol dehydrogenase family)